MPELIILVMLSVWLAVITYNTRELRKRVEKAERVCKSCIEKNLNICK